MTEDQSLPGCITCGLSLRFPWRLPPRASCPAGDHYSIVCFPSVPSILLIFCIILMVLFDSLPVTMVVSKHSLRPGGSVICAGDIRCSGAAGVGKNRQWKGDVKKYNGAARDRVIQTMQVDNLILVINGFHRQVSGISCDQNDQYY